MNLPAPTGPRRNDLPPPGCTGKTFGNDPAFRSTNDELVIMHPSGMTGRLACPWHGPLERSKREAWK